MMSQLSFFSATSSKNKNIENGAAVTSLRSFLFHNDFSQKWDRGHELKSELDNTNSTNLGTVLLVLLL